MGLKQNRFKELSEIADEYLIQKREKIKKQLFEMNMQNRYRQNMSPTFKPHIYKRAKKEIAQIETILKKRELLNT